MATKTPVETPKLSAAALTTLGTLADAGDLGVSCDAWAPARFPTRTLELLVGLGYAKAGKLKKGDTAKYPPYFATAKGKKALEKATAQAA